MQETILCYLKYQSKKNNGRYYLIATNDVKLVEVMRYCFSLYDEIEELYGKNKNEIMRLIDQNNELCNKNNREKKVLDRLNNLDNIIKDLEKKYKNNLI